MWAGESVLNIFTPAETEIVQMPSQATADVDPGNSHGKLQQEFSTLNNENGLIWKHETKSNAGSGVNIKKWTTV